MNMLNRIRQFLLDQHPPSPCLILDRETVRRKYHAFARVLPDSRIFYAIKANPAPELLELLVGLGSCFDCASVPEIDMALAAGATPERISYGNTIKKEADIAAAHDRGISLFAIDCREEAEKIARVAPGARVFCRILSECVGAEWPLSRKFGCAPNLAVGVLIEADRLGLDAYGISFHVGSQQPNPDAWDMPLAAVASVFHELRNHGIRPRMVNLGGGFPAHYLTAIPALETYGRAINQALWRHFGDHLPETIIEPGRGLVGDAGLIKAEVVLVSRKAEDDPLRWVFLDIGKFGGLIETLDEAIRYPIHTVRDGDPTTPCIIAGPTCDSADILYEKTPYALPVSLVPGDEVLIEGTGAYTTTYASIAFNGFEPLRSYVI